MGDGANLVDDLTINGEESLLRRIRSDWWKFDKNLRRKRPKSIAFRNGNGSIAMSVSRQKILIELGKGPESLLLETGDGVASISAQFARDQNQIIVQAPTEADDSHTHVIGDKPKRVQRNFAKVAKWPIEPPD